MTQLPVSLTVGPKGVRRADPARSVVSFLSPEEPWAGDVVVTFCCYVRFFASPTAGAGWVRQHPGTFLLGLDEAFELGRRVTDLRFGPTMPDEVGIPPVWPASPGPRRRLSTSASAAYPLRSPDAEEHQEEQEGEGAKP